MLLFIISAVLILLDIHHHNKIKNQSA